MLRNELYTPWFANNDWGFEIIDGEYNGVVVQVDKVVFTGDDPVGNNLSVDYHVISKPELLKEDDIKGDLFNALFQTIITDIIKEAVDNYEYENNREDNPKESDSQ